MGINPGLFFFLYSFFSKWLIIFLIQIMRAKKICSFLHILSLPMNLVIFKVLIKYGKKNVTKEKNCKLSLGSSYLHSETYSLHTIHIATGGVRTLALFHHFHLLWVFLVGMLIQSLWGKSICINYKGNELLVGQLVQR